MWLDFPVTVTDTSQDRLISSFFREAITPAGRSGHRCIPKTHRTWWASKTPLWHRSLAPPVVSSAGWKRRRTLWGRAVCSASHWARSRTMAMWASWPQACIFPGWREAKGRPVFSWMGRASASLRKAMASARPKSKKAHKAPGMGEDRVHPRGVSTLRR